MTNTKWLFGSLFLGGFECSTHITTEGHRLDLVAVTQHDTQARHDYDLCRRAGIKAVREAARWPIIDTGGKLELSGVRDLARAGREAGLVQIWDLMHYGYPGDLDPFSAEFEGRFAKYARAAAEVIRDETEGTAWFTPINEISYNAWSGGEVGYMAPFARGRGPDLKHALVRAAIAATNEIWEVDPEARILNVDPLVRMHPPRSRPDLQRDADFFNRYVVTEAFDMLAGRIEPELGGSRAHLGVVGFNYYASNQWTIPTPDEPQQFLSWDDPGWIPVSDLILELQARYGGPIVIAETGASATGRPSWLAHLAEQVKSAQDRGADIQGICLYPVVTSPDWEDPTAFFDGGLFDVAPDGDGCLHRYISEPVARALREAQHLLDPQNLLAESLAPEKEPGPAAYGIADLEKGALMKADNFSYRTLLAGDSLVVEEYCFRPGAGLPLHRHVGTEHVLNVVEGLAEVQVGEEKVEVSRSQVVVVPAGAYYGIQNLGTGRLVVQQVSTPKPWDARFGSPHPSGLA